MKWYRFEKLVLPHHTLIRWMLKPEESRMYEGFCRLEASPHGKLDNLFLFFFTPFASLKTFSFDIITNWLQEYDDPQQRQQMIDAGIDTTLGTDSDQECHQRKNYTACDALLLLCCNLIVTGPACPIRPLY